MSAPASHRPVPWWLAALAAIAFLVGAGVPGARFVRKQLRGAQRTPVSEVKARLKSMYTAEREYLMEHDVYTDDLARVGFWVSSGNRYAYFSAAQGRVLPPSERERPSAPFQIAPADPAGRYHRGDYTRFADTGCPVTPVVLPGGRKLGLGVTPAEGAREPVFIGAAAANLDDDATIDCWSIATAERRATDGTLIPAGVPYNEVNDMAY